MKRFLIVLLMLGMLLVSCQGTVKSGETAEGTTAATPETEAQTEEEVLKNRMNVMSFNVYYIDKETTANNDEQVKIDCTVATRGPKLNAMLKGEQIDIVGFQEMSTVWRRWLRDDLDPSYRYVGRAQDCCGQGGYVAYLKDKYEAVDYGVFWLAEGAPKTATKGWDGDHDRICTWVIFRIKETGRYFLFLDTHLDNAGETARVEGSKLIVEQSEIYKEQIRTEYGQEDVPVVLVGDMNTHPDSAPYNTFTSVMRDSRVYSKGATVARDVSTSPGLRYCASEADYSKTGHLIDYVFVSQNITVNNYRMIHTSTNLCPYGEYMSDHNAVIADISF